MQKRLTDEQKNTILDTAVNEFADNGYEKANINKIAEKADVSVGVIYKYFTDKENLFTACVSHCLGFMDDMFAGTGDGEEDMVEGIEALISQVQQECRRHPEYFKLYLQLTAMPESQKTKEVVSLIESTSVRIYQSLIREAKNTNVISEDIDVGLFAFFFDNMMMMLHFAYSCDYYQERFKVFCGSDILDQDELVRQEMMKFLTGAFGNSNAAAEN